MINSDDSHFGLLGHGKKPKHCCNHRYFNLVPRWTFILLVVLIVLSSLALLGLYVVFPVTVRNIVDNSEIEFTHVLITEKRNDSFVMKATGSLLNSGPVAATIKKMKGALSWNGLRLGKIDLPDIHTQIGGVTPLHITSKVELDNIEYYEKFQCALLRSKTKLSWNVNGPTEVETLGQTIQVEINKDIDIPGMQGLAEINVESLEMPRNNPNPPGGVEIVLRISQFNPSILEMHVGDIEFENRYPEYKDSFFGVVKAENVTFRPGWNSLSLSGYAKPESTVAAGLFTSKYLNDKPNKLNVRGIQTSSSIVWVRSLVKDLSLPTIVPGVNMTVMDNINITALSMDIESNDDMFTSSGVTVNFYSPFGFPMSTYEAALDFGIYSIKNKDLYINISTGFNPATSNQETHKLSSSFKHVRLTVIDEKGFGEMLADLLSTPSTSVFFEGTASAKITTAMGNITVNNIPFGETVSIEGFDSFLHPPPFVKTVNVLDGNAENLTLAMDFILTNPIYVGLDLPNFPMNIHYMNHTLGTGDKKPMLIPPFEVVSSVTSSIIHKDGTNQDPINDFFSRHIKGENVTMRVTGDPSRSKINVLKPSLAKFESTTTVEGGQGPVTFLHMTGIEIFKMITPTKMTILNPWDASYAIEAIHVAVSITESGMHIARMDIDIEDDPMIVAANTTTITPPQPTKISVSREDIAKLIEILMGEELKLTVDGTMKVALGSGFKTDIQLYQANIPAKYK